MSGLKYPLLIIHPFLYILRLNASVQLLSRSQVLKHPFSSYSLGSGDLSLLGYGLFGY